MFAYIYSLIEVLVVLVPILLSVAFITVIERKVIAAIQRRVGPNMVGFYGVLQPFADALKLVVKETIIPNHANRVLLFLAPIVTLTFSLLGWAILPLGQGYALADLSLGILYSIALSSVGILGILFAGWSSNSKYAFMGGLRSTSQLISYELILTSVILIVIIITGTFSYTNIIEHQQSIWFVVPLFPLFIIWFFSALAETNRTPFDLPEAESELVSGFNTDYSGIIFVFFFLAEYSNIILISALTSIFFFGGFHFPVIFEQYSFINIQSIIIALKTCVFCFAFVWFRASLPRLRFDQLITACWLTLLPLVIGLMIFIPCVVMAFDCSPYPVLFQSSKSTKFMLIIGIISTVVWLAIVPFFSKTVSSVHYTRIAVMVFLLSLMLGTFLSLDTVELYHSLFSYSPISMMIDSLLLVIGILVLVCFSANSSSPSNGNINEVTLPKSEYSLILIFSILGASIMISANDLISIYVGLELQSFGLYILACLRTDLTGSTHASLKYFLLGAISSAFILLGISLIYQEVGSTIFQSIHSFVTVNTSHESLFILDQGHKLVALGLLSMLCGFIFKISAAPFHSWFSDVIQGVPTATGIVIINLPKISIFTFLFNMLLVCGVITSQTEGMAQDNFLSTTGETFLIITTLFSLIFGTVAGLMQTKMKRLLAFSTISHVGFIIIGVVVGSEVGLNAMIFYLVQYTLTVVLTFLCLVAYEASYIVENKDNAVNNIHELQGTGQYYKLLTFTFVLCLFSIAGIPPLTGFYAKLGVLNSSILQNISLVFLTAIVCSVISAAYYFKVIKVMMFDSVPSDQVQVKKEVLISPLHGYTMAVLTAFLCLFILDPRLIINCTELVALSLYMT